MSNDEKLLALFSTLSASRVVFPQGVPENASIKLRDDVYLTTSKTDAGAIEGEADAKKVGTKVTKKVPAKRKLAKVDDLNDSVSLPTTARGLKKVIRMVHRVWFPDFDENNLRSAFPQASAEIDDDVYKTPARRTRRNK